MVIYNVLFLKKNGKNAAVMMNFRNDVLLLVKQYYVVTWFFTNHPTILYHAFYICL
jgi:hypothetical protein